MIQGINYFGVGKLAFAVGGEAHIGIEALQESFLCFADRQLDQFGLTATDAALTDNDVLGTPILSDDGARTAASAEVSEAVRERMEHMLGNVMVEEEYHD